MIFSIDQINNILNDLWNLHLVLFGASLSIFTLLYSLIVSKRDELKYISDQLKNGGSNPILSQRESFINLYIRRLKTANKHVALILFVTFIMFISAWFTQRFVPDNCFKFVLFYLFSTLTIIILFYASYIFFTILIHYNSDTKV